MPPEIIRQVVLRLFPSDVEVVDQASHVQPNERYLVIPGKSGPRWIVPANPSLGLPALRQWRPWDVTSRLKWALVLACYRAGQLANMPGIYSIGIANSMHSAWPVGKDACGGHLFPAIYIGTPCPSRKAVAIMVDSTDYAASCVIKVPIEPHAGRNIIREADSLDRLGREVPGLAPRLLHVERDRGVAVQEMVTGRVFSSKVTGGHLGFLQRLMISGKQTSLSEQAHRLNLRLTQSAGDGCKAAELISALLSDIDDDTPIPVSWLHGDFAPWNIKRTADGGMVAFDWEFAEPESVPGLDLIHYLCSVRVHLQHAVLDGEVLAGGGNMLLRRMAVYRNVNQHFFDALWRFYLAWYRWVSLESDADTSYTRMIEAACRGCRR